MAHTFIETVDCSTNHAGDHAHTWHKPSLSFPFPFIAITPPQGPLCELLRCGLCYGQVCASGGCATAVPMVSQHGFVLWSGVCQWSVSMGLCYGQVCASASCLCSQHGFVLWSGVCQWSVSMGLCYGQVCASGQSAWVCAMVRCVPVVSQHGFVLWSGVCQWSVSMGLCYGQVCASGQSAWVCAMVRCVPVVSQHGFVLCLCMVCVLVVSQL